MRLRGALVGLALLFTGLAPPLLAPATNACAAAPRHAALVVDTGKQVESYCVAFSRRSVSGIELIELAAEQHGLDYKLGYGGKAVCSLAATGAGGDECFAAGQPYWAYWRAGNGTGGWKSPQVGPDETQVTNGAVEGWSWGKGASPQKHPKPPLIEVADACDGGSSAAGAASSQRAQDSGSEVPPAGVVVAVAAAALIAVGVLLARRRRDDASREG